MCTRNIGEHTWDSPCTHDCAGCFFREEDDENLFARLRELERESIALTAEYRQRKQKLSQEYEAIQMKISNRQALDELLAEMAGGE